MSASEEIPSSSKTRVPFFRPQKSKSASIRKRTEETEGKHQKKENESGSDIDDKDYGSGHSSSSSEPVEAEQIRIKLTEKRSKLGQNRMQMSSKKKRRDVGVVSSEEEEGSDEERAKFDPDVKFASSGLSRTGPEDMGATARTEIDTDYSKDAQSQFERVQNILKKRRQENEEKMALEEEDRKKYGERAKMADLAREAATGSSKPKIYQGLAVYGAREHEDTIKGSASSGLNRMGPIRATQYMRASVRWDYAPDICKDYKETGFCTFGDSCKFMHDRSDYKHGWEIERDWEQGKLKEGKEDEFLVSSEEEGEQEDDKLPHSCHICRQHFKQPVVTKCKHYFCEACALGHYQKSKKCAICGEKTDGVFNVARDILSKMKARNQAKGGADEEEGDEFDESAPCSSEVILPLVSEENEVNSADIDE